MPTISNILIDYITDTYEAYKNNVYNQNSARVHYVHCNLTAKVNFKPKASFS